MKPNREAQSSRLSLSYNKLFNEAAQRDVVQGSDPASGAGQAEPCLIGVSIAGNIKILLSNFGLMIIRSNFFG